MKQVLIIRHAKSSWALPGQSDFERSLNDRGNRDAPMMAKRLFEKKIQVDVFIASPANRALTTAGYFAEAFSVQKNKIKQLRQLYHAHPAVFYEVISSIDDAIGTAALFSHNPGITEFVNELTATKIDNMPTCGIFAVSADIISWKDFAKAKKTCAFFDHPKR